MRFIALVGFLYVSIFSPAASNPRISHPPIIESPEEMDITDLSIEWEPSPTDQLVDWSNNQLRTWAPVSDGMTEWAVKGPGRETLEDRQARYLGMSQDAVSVAFDPEEAPLFPGPNGRAKTAATILSIAWRESGLRKDIDNGFTRGDHGRSWCSMQVQLSNERPHTRKRFILDHDAWKYSNDWKSGWGGEDLAQDRKKCFRAGLHIARVSMKACKYLPLVDRLAVYTSGSCKLGHRSSEARMGTAILWLKKNPPPVADETVFLASN